MNLDLIPCEICHQQFPPDQYIIHITTHSPNDTTTNSHNTNSHSHTNHNNSNLSVIDTIPCHKCSQQIPLSEYDSHLLMHSLSNSNSQSNSNTNTNTNYPNSIPNSNSNATIPCPKCNQQIPIAHYETHQLSHFTDTTNHSTHSQPHFVQCEYPNCSTQWIPSHEYTDHLTLHKLQSQQSTPNTSNDAVIALHTQTQLIQRQTAADPRRICLSNAFIHLSNTQRPVIPMHNPLIQSINNTSPNTNAHTHLPQRDHHNVSGIISALEHVLSTRNNIEYYLCNEVSFYYRDREDYSWGCGFRNCQTVTSTLTTMAIYTRSMYSGIGYVPIITQIQKYLDYAHGQGFDPEGLKELGRTEGTRQWIGAVDVCALLRSWSIPASVFDFQLSNNESYHTSLFDWVWEYFVQRYKYCGIENGNGQKLISNYFENGNGNNKSVSDDTTMRKVLEMSRRESESHKIKNKMEMDSDSGSSFSDGNECVNEEKKMSENEKELFYWDAYDSDKGNGKGKYTNVSEKKHSKGTESKEKSKNKNKNGKKFIPALYFQHQGHSRTIIGVLYNKKSKIRHLLVLDPSVKNGGINLLKNIKNGNYQQLLRSKKQIKAAKYQIVAIPSFGIMTNSDRNRCKTIQSMDVALMNRKSSK